MRSRRHAPHAALLVLGAAFLTTFVGGSATARAEIRRYALLVGANVGFAHEQPLRYAESDVDAMADTLVAVGGFASERVVRMKKPTPERLRNALVDLNLAIQRDVRDGGEAVLFVYYSGHADGERLHLGKEALATDELSKLVRLSSARLKLLLVDACRAGALTRVKGGRPVAPFQIGLADELRNEGYAIITSSAAGEDAQESDELRSSIFSHHFLAALRGAADVNRDRLVTLGEAYGYAYQQALATSMTTIAGAQHATFEYDLRGRADPVLADLRNPGDEAQLALDVAGDWLLTSVGAGVWELSVARPGTTILVPAGTYRARVRTRASVLEADLALAPGERRTMGARELKPLPLAQVVRKGASSDRLALGPTVSGSAHGPLGSGFSPMVGGHAGFAFELPSLTLLPRIGFGRGAANRLADGVASHQLTELTLELAALYVIDLGRSLSVAPLASVGGAQIWQTVEREACVGDGAACRFTRTPRALVTSLGAWAGLSLAEGLALEATLELVSFYLPRDAGASEGAPSGTLSGTLTWRAGVGVGYRY